MTKSLREGEGSVEAGDIPTAPTNESQSKHTPAPWDWFTHTRTMEKRASNQPQLKFLVGADGQGFAHTVGLEEPRDTANAILIAAAPDLLAALKQARGAFYKCAVASGTDPEFAAIACGTYDAAIAKAEGR